MKTYIVYNSQGYEVALIKAKSHNDAEKKAIILYGDGSSVAYTEI
jgi:hypothetical protein